MAMRRGGSYGYNPVPGGGNMPGPPQMGFPNVGGVGAALPTPGGAPGVPGGWPGGGGFSVDLPSMGGVGDAIAGAAGWIKDNPDVAGDIAGAGLGIYEAQQQGKHMDRQHGLQERQVEMREEEQRRSKEREERRRKAARSVLMHMMQSNPKMFQPPGEANPSPTRGEG